MSEVRPTIRLDKWLWFARFFKSRGLSAKVVASGHCRVNSLKVVKGSLLVRAGDVITFPKEDCVRVIEVLDVGERRGPAFEAQALYLDLSPPICQEMKANAAHPEAQRSGRPNRQDRLALEKFKGKD